MSSEMEFIDLKGENSSCRVYLFGATITSWKVKDVEYIFVSPKAVFDGKKAIRGGIPVCFPSFGPWKFGSQHGFARSSNWVVASPVEVKENGDVTTTLRLTDTEETRSKWDFKFTLDYKITVGKDSLSLEFELVNSSSESMEFTTALHTYYRVPHVSKCSIAGLTGLKFIDKTVEGTPTNDETRDLVTVEQFTDRVYLGPCPPVEVSGFDDGCKLVLTSTNLPDTVVWNPWEKKAAEMGDLGGENWPGMLCVEAGQCVDPVSVEPGKTWTATHVIKLVQ